MKFSLIAAGVSSVLGIGVGILAARPAPFDVARDSSCETVTVSEVALAGPVPGRNFWCILAHPDNTDGIHFKLGATATTSEPELKPGSSFCDGDGGTVYSGRVDVIAASGTQSYCTVEY